MKLRVGTIVRLKNNEYYRNTYAVVNEVLDDESHKCAVTIYNDNDKIQNEMSWLDEGIDFIICQDQTFLPTNPPENFLLISDIEMSVFIDYGTFEDIPREVYKEYYEICKEEVDENKDMFTDDYIEYLEELKNDLIRLNILNK